MNKLNLSLKLLIVLVFVLFFTIIGLNKKAIDSFNTSDLEYNIDNVRGVLWANYTFIVVSVAIGITVIVSKRYYFKYKWIVGFSIMYILLLTGLTVYEEISIRNYREVDKSALNNVYVITTIMNFIYFILFVKLMNITDTINAEVFILSDQFNRNNDILNERYMPRVNRNINASRQNRYVPDLFDEEEYFDGLPAQNIKQYNQQDIRKVNYNNQYNGIQMDYDDYGDFHTPMEDAANVHRASY
uniref:Uncharacterized protein n=1 Tax=viral metagenome TaxID=1070528 RepID=A0A6C0I6X7_9ZZZZ